MADTITVRSRGRRGGTIVPNWRWEDPALDSYTLHVAGWLASHTDSYRDTVSRNAIARATGISRTRVSDSLTKLEALGVIEIETGDDRLVNEPGSDHPSRGRWRITFDFDTWERRDATRPVDGTPDVQSTDATRPQQDATRPVTGRHTSAVVNQGENQPENQAEQDVVPTSAQITHRIMSDYWQFVQRETRHKPVGITAVAFKGVVLPFIDEGYSQTQVKVALAAMFKHGVGIARQSLERELNGTAPRRNGKVDVLAGLDSIEYDENGWIKPATDSRVG